MIRYHLRRKTWREKHKSTEGPHKVNDTSPQALAVHYTVVAHGKRRCGDCDFYAGPGTAAEKWAACRLFENRLVSRDGACDAWEASVDIDER